MAKLQPIKIELEIDPAMCLMFVQFLNHAAQGSMEAYAILTPTGKKEMHKICQNMMDQISDKTVFPDHLKKP